jgi:prolyl-tRNA synthetase
MTYLRIIFILFLWSNTVRQSRFFSRTTREVPRDAHTIAHQLLIRGGFLKQVTAGVYVYMPLLSRVLHKISQIVREEMNKAGAEELLMPALQPAELWQESGRWDRYTKIDGIMFSFNDRRNSTVCLGPTHEEVITDVVRSTINSYKDLPVNLYQIQTKFRDEIRPRFGLLRAREFIMKDAYSFDADEDGAEKSFLLMEHAYHAICKRLNLNYRCVEADAGAIGGSGSKEFMALSDIGEDTLLICPESDYGANQERAESRLIEYAQSKVMEPMSEVYGKDIIGVEALANFLNVPVPQTTKTIIYRADNNLVAVMVRGDCNVNELKVQNYLKCSTLALATPEEIFESTNAEVGYAGAVNLPENIMLLADQHTQNLVNFECGGNKTHYHNINVNFGRDCRIPIFGDFKIAEIGHLSPNADVSLIEAKGIEIGHIFRLGTKYSEAMQCNFLDAEGKSKPMIMGCYGIGVSRIAAAIIDQYNDENGIIWPINVAPYQIHLIGLNLEKPEVASATEDIYKNLIHQGLEVLFDDRNMRAGEKFNDADLIGIPIRVTLSARQFKEGTVEVVLRKDKNKQIVQLDKLLPFMKNLINELAEQSLL